jgi:hypothetical protein
MVQVNQDGLKLNGTHQLLVWSLTLREERRLRVLEIRVMRRIFGARRDEVTRGVEETT